MKNTRDILIEVSRIVTEWEDGNTTGPEAMQKIAKLFEVEQVPQVRGDYPEDQ